MANLNLSEFTEKTFVADADWTFVWDAAGAISKKVSRNNWLNSGTLTTSAPVTISQTWDALAVAFTAFKVNATSTNSAASSLLLDLQVGGTSRFSVTKDGVLQTAPSVGVFSLTDSANNIAIGVFGFYIGNGGLLSFSVAGASNSARGTSLLLDGGANTLALRNGAAAQTFNVYGTYTSGSAYARLAIACDTSGNATLTTQSTGTAGTVSINGVPVGLGKDNVTTNIAIGTNALNLQNILESSRNIGIGNNSLRYTSLSCVAIGIDAMQNATSASISGNVAVGDSALFATTSPGNRNTGIGYWAMRGNNSSDSVGVGWAVLVSTTATNTCALGAQAGRYITGGATNNSVASNSIYIGNDTKAAASGQTNQIVIGYDATGLGSNTAVLGNASITTTALRGNVGIGTTAPSEKLHVVGNALFGQKVGVATVTPLNVSFGGTYGTNTPGSIGNQKWEMYNDGTTTNRYGIGMSLFLMEFQAGISGAFGFYPNNGTTSALHIISSGNVGIGTTAPSSKLQVTGGDVEIETVTSGIIMKAAGTSTRYRITLNAGGTALVFTAV